MLSCTIQLVHSEHFSSADCWLQTNKLANRGSSRAIHYPITVHIKVPRSKSPTYSVHRPERLQEPIETVKEMPFRASTVQETTPLLWQDDRTRYRSSDRLPLYTQDLLDEGVSQQRASQMKNAHAQFCALTGCPPSNLSPKDKDKFHVPKKSLYGRTVAQLSSQRRVYNLSASINNLMLLSQVILGAALTALGASASSHILITLFGATNTIIAGLVAYLKSRGQPMRARMYRDDLERIVDEIENSEVMWRGISEGAHGYDDIDTDDVTVRSEVARLTRLYDRAIRLNGMNNPDMYMAGAGEGGNNTSGLRNRGAGGGANLSLPAVAPTAPQPSAPNAGPAVPISAVDPEDVSPATKADHDKQVEQAKDKKEEKVEDKGKQPEGEPSKTDGASDVPAPATSPKPQPAAPVAAPEQSQVQPPAPVADPDASPATAPRLKPKRTKSDKARESDDSTKKVAGEDEH